MKKESLIGQPAAYLSMDCNEGGFGAPRPPQYGGRDGLNPDARRANGFRNLFSKDCSSPALFPLSFLFKRVKTRHLNHSIIADYPLIVRPDRQLGPSFEMLVDA